MVCQTKEKQEKTYSDISMIVLAGGKSSRMGQDKADLRIGEETFLEHQIRKGRMLGIQDIVVSGYRGSHCSVPIIGDRITDRGPLGGLEACLREIRHPMALVLSIDVPLVPVEELRKLIDFAGRQGVGEAVALAHGDHQEPLIAVYPAALADEMLWEITERKGSVFGFLRRIGCVWYASDGEDRCFVNINNPELYQHVLSEHEF